MNKWRLPTKEELNWLYENKKELFKKAWYWSGSEYENDPSYAWALYLDTGMQDYNKKTYYAFVRPIRGLFTNLQVYEEELGSVTWDEAVEACDAINSAKEVVGKKISIHLDTKQVLSFIGKYRRDLEKPNWHYYEITETKEIIHIRKNHIVMVVEG